MSKPQKPHFLSYLVWNSVLIGVSSGVILVFPLPGADNDSHQIALSPPLPQLPLTS